MNWICLTFNFCLCAIVAWDLLLALIETLSEINRCLSSLRYLRDQERLMQGRAWVLFTNGIVDVRGNLIAQPTSETTEEAANIPEEHAHV